MKMQVSCLPSTGTPRGVQLRDMRRYHYLKRRGVRHSFFPGVRIIKRLMNAHDTARVEERGKDSSEMASGDYYPPKYRNIESD
jgi:hypothetical protein